MREPSAPRASVAARKRAGLGGRRVNWRALAYWAGVAACVAALTMLGKQLVVTQPYGEGPAGPSVPAAAFAESWSDEPTVLIVVTEGLTNPARFAALLQRNDDAQYPEMRGKDLGAVFPRLAEQAASSLDADALELTGRSEPQAVVVAALGYDALLPPLRKPALGLTAPGIFGFTLNQLRWSGPRFHRRAARLARRTATAFPAGAEVFLANLPDPTDGAGDLERAGMPAWPEFLEALATYNRAIASVAVAHKRVHLVDLHTLFQGHGMHAPDRGRASYHAEDPHPWLEPDLRSLNARGVDAARRAFLLRMSQVYAARAGARGSVQAVPGSP